MGKAKAKAKPKAKAGLRPMKKSEETKEKPPPIEKKGKVDAALLKKVKDGEEVTEAEFRK